MSAPATLGARIRALRGNQKPVAFIASVGLDIDQSTLGRYERDEVPNPSARILQAIAAGKGVTVGYLLTGEDHIRPQEMPSLESLELLATEVERLSHLLDDAVSRLERLEQQDDR